MIYVDVSLPFCSSGALVALLSKNSLSGTLSDNCHLQADLMLHVTLNKV
jgi:hypothetical protein